MDDELKISYPRIQQRLVEHGRFQMRQTTVLQDDEIERLKCRLMTMEGRISQSRRKWRSITSSLETQVDSQTSKLAQIKSQHRFALQQMNSKHRVKRTKMASAHSQELVALRARSAESYTSPTKPRDDDGFGEILGNLSALIEEALSQSEEQSERQIDQTNESLLRLKSRVRMSRDRIAQLSAEIDAARKKMVKKRARTTQTLTSLDDRTAAIDSRIAASRSALDDALRSGEDDLLRDLRLKIQEARGRIEAADEKIDNAKARFQRRMERYDAEKAQLSELYAEGEAGFGEEGAFRRAAKAGRKLIAQINGSLAALDLELQELRQENLELLRNVNERDYAINGRGGSRQRSSQLASRSKGASHFSASGG
jgi:chromosome segregation ATPase